MADRIMLFVCPKCELADEAEPTVLLLIKM